MRKTKQYSNAMLSDEIIKHPNYDYVIDREKYESFISELPMYMQKKYARDRNREVNKLLHLLQK